MTQAELAEVMAYHGFDEATARRFLSRGDALIYVPSGVRVTMERVKGQMTYHYSEPDVWHVALCGVRYGTMTAYHLDGIGAIDAAYVCAGCLEAAGKGL